MQSFRMAILEFRRGNSRINEKEVITPLDTRAKKREPCPAAVELAINESMAKLMKLNVPRTSMAGDSVIIKACLIDISMSGCGIDSPYLIPPGLVLDIKIDAALFNIEGRKERKEPIKAVGKITSCVMKGAGHYRIGVFFTNITKEDVDFMDNFIKSKDQRKDKRWDMTK